MEIKRTTVLALDLEGTLISNAVSQFPRPGLREFIEFCLRSFGRVVLFTAVNEARVRSILKVLAEEGELPTSFADSVEVVAWSGKVKDLRFIKNAEPHEILLVDDREEYVAPGQHSRWIPIREFEGPTTPEDRELGYVAQTLEKLLSS